MDKSMIVAVTLTAVAYFHNKKMTFSQKVGFAGIVREGGLVKLSHDLKEIFREQVEVELKDEPTPPFQISVTARTRHHECDIILNGPQKARVYRCCICGEVFACYGHSPHPIMEDGECCPNCNTKVLQERFKLSKGE